MLSNVFLFLPLYVWIIADMETKGIGLSVGEYGGFIALAGFIVVLRLIKKVIK